VHGDTQQWQACPPSRAVRYFNVLLGFCTLHGADSLWPGSPDRQNSSASSWPRHSPPGTALSARSPPMRAAVYVRVIGQLDCRSTCISAFTPPASRKLSSMGALYGQSETRLAIATAVGSLNRRDLNFWFSKLSLKTALHTTIAQSFRPCK
jgi:hypothetical protein